MNESNRELHPAPLWQRIVCALIGFPAFFGALAELLKTLNQGGAGVNETLLLIPLLGATLLFCSIALFGRLPVDLVRERDGGR